MKHQEHHRADDHYDLHSLHKNSASKIVKMKPLSALVPPTSGAPQPKVYKVKPIHFRELVQKLTGAQPEVLQQQPQSQPRPRQQTSLQRVAPPPLPLHPHQLQLQLVNQTNTQSVSEKQQPKVEQVDQKSFSDNKMQNGVGTELILSPNFQAWFSFAMMSPGPGAITQMEQR